MSCKVILRCVYDYKDKWGFLLSLLILWSCQNDNHNDLTTKDFPESVSFPDCKLTKTETLLGSYELLNYNYKEGLLVERRYSLNSGPESKYRYVYNDQKQPIHMLSIDSKTSATDTILTFEYENDLLAIYTHHYKIGQDKKRDKSFYSYNNGHLTELSSQGKNGLLKYKITTDKYGNPIKYKLVLSEGEEPKESLEYVLSYDDKPNPYYKMPDFLRDSYFCQNNIVSFATIVNGVVVEENNKEYEYFASGFPSKIIEKVKDSVSLIRVLEYNCN